MTASEVEQLGRVLLPLFKEATAEDRHAFRDEVHGAITRNHADVMEAVTRIESTVRDDRRATEKRIDSLDEVIFGNPAMDRLGLVDDVRDLKNHRDSRRKIGAAAVLQICGMVAGIISGVLVARWTPQAAASRPEPVQQAVRP